MHRRHRCRAPRKPDSSGCHVSGGILRAALVFYIQKLFVCFLVFLLFTLSTKMTTFPLTRIPDLTEAEYRTIFYLFHEGLAHNPELSKNAATMAALHALQAANIVHVKLPGES
jgi:hypothetical protein